MDEKLKRRTDSILQFKFKNLKSKEKNKWGVEWRNNQKYKLLQIDQKSNSNPQETKLKSDWNEKNWTVIKSS
jgi:hypothetical protein